TTRRRPAAISTTPTKFARNSGAGIPSLANRPTPWLGERNLIRPEAQKTPPTASRIRIVAGGAVPPPGRKSHRNCFFIVIRPFPEELWRDPAGWFSAHC